MKMCIALPSSHKTWNVTEPLDTPVPTPTNTRTCNLLQKNTFGFFSFSAKLLILVAS
jgi:hypothetical protein